MSRKKNSTSLQFALVSLIAVIFVFPAMGQTHPTYSVPPSPPLTGWQPAAAGPARSITESTNASPPDLLTHFEKSNYVETGRYAEALELCRKLEKRSPLVKVQTIGTTPQGRDLVVVIVSRDRAFTPEAAAKTGKPVIFIQNGIHSGEIGGKDASLMFLRDVVVTKKYAALLDHVILLVMPVFNIDGHERVSPYNRINQAGPREMGFRVTAQRKNLNRDYLKADTPEMRAWLRMWTSWNPDFLMDNHVTDGMDYQYDVTISIPSGAEVWPTVGTWIRNSFLPKFQAGLEQEGHVVGPYIEPIDEQDVKKGFQGGPSTPRFSTGYAAICSRPGLLVETHSLKPYRTQVWSHYDVIVQTLQFIAENPSSLKQAVTQADEQIAALSQKTPGSQLYLSGKLGTASEPYAFRGVTTTFEPSPITGSTLPRYGSQPVTVDSLFYDQTIPTASPVVPYGYFIPAEWTEVIDLLKAHGIQLKPVSQDVTLEVEEYTFQMVKWADRPFEGRHLISSFELKPRTRTLTFPAGTMFVPMNQRMARVAFNILEPEGPDSALRWGRFDSIFEQKEYFSDYVMEPIARKMLELNPKLREEFERRLKNDAQFAADPQARLYFFYQRSPYFEADKDVYPVVRVMHAFK